MSRLRAYRGAPRRRAATTAPRVFPDPSQDGMSAEMGALARLLERRHDHDADGGAVGGWGPTPEVAERRRQRRAVEAADPPGDPVAAVTRLSGRRISAAHADAAPIPATPRRVETTPETAEQDEAMAAALEVMSRLLNHGGDV